MAYYLKHAGGRRWAEKSTSHLGCVERLVNLYPEAQYIIIVRDPRDAFCSARFVHWNQNKTINPKLYAQRWSDLYTKAVGTLIKNTADWYLVRHESVIMDARKTLKNLFEWLGEEFRGCFRSSESQASRLSMS